MKIFLYHNNSQKKYISYLKMYIFVKKGIIFIMIIIIMNY